MLTVIALRKRLIQGGQHSLNQSNQNDRRERLEENARPKSLSRAITFIIETLLALGVGVVKRSPISSIPCGKRSTPKARSRL